MSEITRKIAKGRIIKVSRSGWGFISSKDIAFTRIFFHWTNLIQNTLKFTELKTGMFVEFTPIETPDKGYRALHLKVIDRPIEPLTKDEEDAADDETGGIPEAKVFPLGETS